MAKKNIDAEQLLKHIEAYKVQLYDSKTVSSKKFMDMQSAIHGCKLIIHSMAGTKMSDEERMAWIK